MVNALDFFPSTAQRHITNQERRQLDTNCGHHSLVVNIPLRYIFQYALNHLQAEDPRKLHGEQGASEQAPRSVLIVTPSKTELQRCMLQERDLYNHHRDSVLDQPTKSQLDDHMASTIDPWRHLFPTESPLGTQDEFSSVTQTQTQTQTQMRDVNASGHVHKAADSTTHRLAEDTGSEEASFQPELWARIQIRYAPTISHLQSLFRCLHVDAEATRGRTFGQDMDGSRSESEQSRMPVPSLVLLIGCFGSEDISNLLSRPTVAVDPSSSSNEAYSALPLPGQQQHRQSMHVQSTPHGEQDRVDRLKSISKAMSEIKDGLEWIHQRSGHKPGLVLFEETKPGAHALGHQSYKGAEPQASEQTLDMLGPSMPSPQELSLQKALGFWVDAMITVERDSGEKQDQHGVEVAMEGSQMMASWTSVASNDSYRLWIRTHESLRAMVSSSPNDTVASGMDKGDTGRAAASAGTVLGLRWHFNMVDNRFRLQTLT